MALTLAETLLRQGLGEPVEALIGEAETDPGLLWEAVLVRQEWLMHARPELSVAYSDQQLPAAIAHLERLADDALLAKAHFARVRMHQLAGVFGPAIDDAFAAAEYARRAGDRGLLLQALMFASWALLYGPTDQATTERRLSEIDAGDLGVSFHAFELGGQAALVARAGRFDEARALFRETDELLDELGLVALRSAMSMWTSQLELQAGDVPAAVADLRGARDALERVGERAYRSTVTAYLADALYANGCTREAEQMADLAEAESAAVDAINFAVADGVRARVAADRGEFEVAEQLARRAVAAAFRMDMPKARGDAQAVLAEVLRAGGKLAEADDAFARAIAEYERKGELAAAALARRRFAGGQPDG